MQEAENRAKRRNQKRREQCFACRFHEPLSEPVEKRKCTNKKAKGIVSKGDSCPFFERRWPENLTPVELEE